MPTLPSCSDYTTSIIVNGLVKAPQLAGGAPELYKGRPIKYSGGFCIVYPYVAKGKKYAVRCWHAYLDGAKERTRIISEKLICLHLPYFVGFEYVENGIITPTGPQPIVVMDWVEAKPLKQFIKENLLSPAKLNDLAENFARMVKDLHEHNLSHGDLQHGNIMVKPDSSIVLVDYDSMYVPELDGWSDVISGLAGYQHPARWNNKTLTPKADYFSELVIYTSLKALSEDPSLWNDLNIENTDTLLFSQEDIESGGNSSIFSRVQSINSCSDLIERMKEFLSFSSLDDLLPLEESTKSIVDDLSNLWGDNGYKPGPSFVKSEIDEIASMWK